MQAKPVIPDADKVRSELNIFKRSMPLFRETEVAIQKPRSVFRSHKLIFRHPLQTKEQRVIDDALELVDCLHELDDGIFIFDLLRNKTPSAEHREVTLLSHTLPIALRKEEIDRVLEIRTLIEVALRGAREKAKLSLR